MWYVSFTSFFTHVLKLILSSIETKQYFYAVLFKKFCVLPRNAVMCYGHSLSVSRVHVSVKTVIDETNCNTLLLCEFYDFAHKEEGEY